MKTPRRFAWSHPEWWVCALCAGAWSMLVFGPSHAAHHARTISLADWAMMVLAMMIPLVIAHVRVTAARSLWNRRHRAIAGFLGGFTAIWLAVGVLLAAGMRTVNIPIATPVLAPCAFMLASVWELTRVKRRLLAACHATLPLAPRGWKADLDALRYGCFVGARCVGVCGLAMIGCALAGHNLLVMLAASAGLYSERQFRVPVATHAAALVVVAVAVAMANALKF